MNVKECTTLDELRSEIDVLDDTIVELIAARNQYIHQAASFKESVEEVKAEDRVEAVLNRTRHKALTLGLSPNLITDVYRLMINQMVESEISEFRNTKAI